MIACREGWWSAANRFCIKGVVTDLLREGADKVYLQDFKNFRLKDIATE